MRRCLMRRESVGGVLAFEVGGESIGGQSLRLSQLRQKYKLKNQDAYLSCCLQNSPYMESPKASRLNMDSSKFSLLKSA